MLQCKQKRFLKSYHWEDDNRQLLHSRITISVRHFFFLKGVFYNFDWFPFLFFSSYYCFFIVHSHHQYYQLLVSFHHYNCIIITIHLFPYSHIHTSSLMVVSRDWIKHLSSNSRQLPQYPPRPEQRRNCSFISSFQFRITT